jgi:hypothetical protein
MAITYSEFDTTPANVVSALKTAILANTHWTDQGVVAANTTSTSATATNNAVVNLTSVDGFTVGQSIVANPGQANEVFRTVTAVSGLTITVNANWGVVFASGTTFRARSTVLKSTSDRGAALIVDLEGEALGTNVIGLATYRAYTGTAPGGWTDRQNYWLYWKAVTATTTTPIHVTLSVGKNHLFIAIEGPRAHETSAQSTIYGSVKNYFAMSDLIAYHAADTVAPAIAIGQSINATAGNIQYNSHQVQISRDSANTTSWSQGRLASLEFPTIYSTDVVPMNRACTIDGNTYLLPYVLFSEAEGIRGRLSSFFYANSTAPSPFTDLPDPVGVRVEYDGIIYKLLAVNKGDGTNVAWGPFGSAANNSSVMRSIIVAVPYAVAV